MKKLIKVLSMLLCMALLMSTAPVDLLYAAYSEETEFAAEQEPVPAEEPAQEAEPTPAEEPTQDESEVFENSDTVEEPAESKEPATPDFTETEEPSGEDAASDADSIPTEEPNTIDYSANASASEAFTCGFAEIYAGGTLVYESEHASAGRKAELSAGVVYALSRSNGDVDRLMIAFNAGSNKGIDTGWVDANRVRPMEPTQEVPAYIAYCSDFEGLLYYNNSSELPLARIGCTYVEAAPAQSAAPEQSGSASNPQTEESSDAAGQEHPVVAPAEPEQEHPVIAPAEPEAEEGQNSETDPETDALLPELDEPLVTVEDVTPSIKEDRIDLYPGDTVQLNLELPEGEHALLTSDNIKVATVSETGVVTAIAPGSATVTLSAGDEQDTVEIAVIAASAEIAETALKEVDADKYRLRSSTITLGVGDTFQISDGPDGIIEVDEGYFAYGYGCQSGATSYATVSANGLITAKKKGTAKITIGAKKSDGTYIKPYKTLTVKVVAATTSVALSASELALGVGMSSTLNVKFSSSSTYGDFVVENTNSDVLKVTQSDTALYLEALKPGMAAVTVRTNLKGYTDTCIVTVAELPTKIAITANKTKLSIGENGGKVTATVVEPAGAMGKIEYTSDNPNLKVDEAGNLKPIGECSATITATVAGVSASVAIEVTKAPSSFTLNSTTLKLGVGDTYALSEDPNNILNVEGGSASFTYKGTNAAYASVNASGLITAKKAGTGKTKITITPDSSGLSAQNLSVNVYKATTSIKLNASAMSLGVGMKDSTLKVSFSASNAYGDFTVKSSNEKVLKVTQNGTTLTLDPIAPGEATITVRTTNKGYVDTCAVTVLRTPEDDEITFTVPEKIGVGEKGLSVSASYSPSNAMAVITYESSDPSKITVNKTTGALTAIKAGDAYIKVLKNGNPVAQKQIHILDAPTGINLNTPSIKLEVGRTFQISDGENGIFSIEPAGARASYTYKSSNASIATVSAAGVITGKKVGTATITIAIAQNTKKTVKLTVKVVKAGTTFAIKPAKATLNLEDTLTLSATNVPATGYTVSYEAEDNSIVEIVGNEATAKKDGKTTVWAVATNDATGEKTRTVSAATITVLPAPDEGDIVFDAGSVMRISPKQPEAYVTASCINGKGSAFEYSIDGKPAGISIDSKTGLLTCTATSGSFTVRATATSGGASRTMDVQIVPAGTISGLKPTSLTLGVGETYRITDGSDGIIVLNPANATASYTFKSSNAAIAAVNSAGIITAKKVGTAKITVTRIAGVNVKGESKTLTVKVAKAPTSVKLSPAVLTIGRGMTGTLTSSIAKDYCEITSSNPEVLSVSADAKTVTVCAEVNEDKYAKTKVNDDDDVLAYVTITVKTYNDKIDTALVAIVDGPKNSEDITVTANRARLGMGEKTGVVTATASTGMASFTYSSSDKNVVAVDPTTGVLTTGSKTGKATITATATNTGVSNTCEIEVCAAPTGISAKTLKLGVGNTYSLMDDPDGIITLSPAGAASGYTYSVTSGASYISINKTTGVITAKKNGTAKIKITTFNKYNTTLTVSVYKLSSTATLSASTITLGEGMSTKLSVKFASSAYSHFTVESSNPIVSVNTATGMVTAGTLPEGEPFGEATITLRTDNGKVDTCYVKVLPRPERSEIIVEPETQAVTLGVGEKNVRISLAAPTGTMAEFEYESKNTAYVKVDAATGVLTGVNATKNPVTVIARDKNHPKDIAFEFAVTVVPKPSAITLTSTALKLGVGDTYQIAEVANGGIVKVVSPENARASYTYKSGNTSVVTVSSTGLLTAKAKGSATVRIYTQDTNVYKDLTVTVVANKITNIALNYNKYELYVNGSHTTDTVKLIPELTGTALNYGNVTYSSNNEKVATVDADGVITATYDASGSYKGTATITATVVSNASLKATCVVTVGELATDVKLASNDVTLAIGDVHKAEYQFTPSGSGMRMTYASQNEEIAQVDADGNITAVSGGNAQIDITGQDDTKLSLKLTVLYNPNSVTLPIQKLIMKPGDAVTLEYALAYNAIDDVTKLNTRTDAASSKTAVATVAKAAEVDGYTITAVAEGTALITVSAAGGAEATCEITVTNDENLLRPRFNWETDPAIMVDDTAEIDLVLTADLFNGNGYTVESSNSETLEVLDNERIHAIKEGSVTLSLKLQKENGEFETMDTVTVTVIPKEKAKLWLGNEVVGNAVEMDVSTFTTTYARHELRIDLGAADDHPLLLSKFEVTIEPSLLTVDKNAKTLSTTAQTGKAKVTVSTVAGDTVVTVTVVPAPVYRALLISEYNGAGGTSVLPFAQNNIDGLKGALSKSNIGGQKYDTLNVLKNPSEAQIKSGIASTFAGATKNDVSFIYIIAHGHLNDNATKQKANGKSADYYFSISGTSSSSRLYTTDKANTMVTDDELWSWISVIPGKVVLVISSCHSGGFIEHHTKNGNLAKAGNIAVCTGQITETNESYYVSYKGIKTHEFWSRSVYTALGNPYKAGDEWGSSVNADKVSGANNDGYISISEMFKYARNLTHDMVKKYAKKTYYVDGKTKGVVIPGVTTTDLLKQWMAAASNYGQDPQSYIPNSMHDLTIVGY